MLQHPPPLLMFRLGAANSQYERQRLAVSGCFPAVWLFSVAYQRTRVPRFLHPVINCIGCLTDKNICDKIRTFSDGKLQSKCSIRAVAGKGNIKCHVACVRLSSLNCLKAAMCFLQLPTFGIALVVEHYRSA